MSLSQEDAAKLVKLRADEWTEHQQSWRFLHDSLEGGERYRRADYMGDPTKEYGDGASAWSNFGVPLPIGAGPDATTGRQYDIAYGQIVKRNLIPHQSETSPEGRDLYVMRLERTPVPAYVRLCVQTHLARIYSREVRRTGPPAVEDWWDDTDGRETTVDRWMAETVAPLLSLFGQLDVAVTKPAAPEGVAVETRADQTAAGLPDVVASVVLPENVVAWELDGNGAKYAWALTFERDAAGKGYRHWTKAACDYYTPKGEHVPAKSWEHNLGFVPLRRYFDQRKARCGNVGVSDYEQIADRSRAIYNLMGDVILNSVLMSNPILQGPADQLGPDKRINTGPGNVLPVSSIPGTASSLGWSFVSPDQSPGEAIRSLIREIADDIDRLAGLSRPAGTHKSTVAQSGVSKVMDSVDGNALLAKKADTLQACEIGVAEMAYAVVTGSWPDPEAVQVTYAKQFDLFTATDIAQALDDMARTAAGMGAFPLAEYQLLDRLILLYLPGLPDPDLDAIRKEIKAKVEEAGRAYVMSPQTPLVTTDASPFGTGPNAVPIDVSPQLATSKP